MSIEFPKIRSLIVIPATCILLAAGCSISTDSQSDVTPAADGLSGKLFAGYQGWYRTPTDGSGLGYEHYETYAEDFFPGEAGIDYWPDLSELPESAKYATEFKHADGSTAYVYSSQDEEPVDLHFKWMAEYGIDGVFLQRFALDVVGFHHQSDLLLPSNNQVLANVQKGANNHKRAYAIMYDLSGMPKGEMGRVINDWKLLNDQYDMLHDSSYLHEGGKPLVAIWGVGFKNREYTLEEVGQLMDFLRNDPEYGGCNIMLGIPTYWRTLGRDTIDDPALLELIAKADVILPWTVGRFGGVEAALKREKEEVLPDIQWCEDRGITYMPLAFPGFSWANRYKEKNAKFDHIPREDGRFLWAQAVAAKRAGAETLYIAMFDEMDEGTQIYKVSNDVPVGKTRFLDYKPHAPDYYLRLAGQVRRLMAEEIPATDELPEIP